MRKTTKIIIVSLILAIILLGIGYAAIQNITLNITGTAAADPSQSNFKVMFTGTPNVSDTNLANASITDDTKATINVSGLDTKGESVSVIYTVENKSTDLSADLTILTTNTNLEYFTITSKIEKVSLIAGESTTVLVKVELTKQPIEEVNAQIGVVMETRPVQPGEEGTSGLLIDFSQTPNELNEYGFYFDMPYSAILDESHMSLVFYEDGSAESYKDGRLDGDASPAGTFSYEYGKIYSTGMIDPIGIISEDGMTFEFSSITWELDLELEKIPNNVYFNNTNDEKESGYKYFPLELADGDCYIYEDYLYYYEAENNGWHVLLCDKKFTSAFDIDIQLPYEISYKESSYRPILENVLNKPVVSMEKTFFECENLIEAPQIPNCVTNIENAFGYCSKLEVAPIIPNSVTDMRWAFFFCSSLKNAPVIPENVTSLKCTFMKCSSLESAPVIPSNVVELNFAFFYCTALKGTIEINMNNIEDVTDCFYNVDMSKLILTGTSSKDIINTIGATGLNYTPIV